MKGYCKWCGCEIDEVEYVQFDGAHYNCSKVKLEVKHPTLRVKKGNTIYHYVCDTAEWNFYLNRFYPKAVLTHTIEKLNN